jgi:hypothetical protein
MLLLLLILGLILLLTVGLLGLLLLGLGSSVCLCFSAHDLLCCLVSLLLTAWVMAARCGGARFPGFSIICSGCCCVLLLPCLSVPLSSAKSLLPLPLPVRFMCKFHRWRAAPSSFLPSPPRHCRPSCPSSPEQGQHAHSLTCLTSTGLH